MRFEFARRVPPQLLGCQPAFTLYEAAFDLPEVNGRIQGLAAVMNDIDTQGSVLARQRVDNDLRHGGAVREIEKRPATDLGRRGRIQLRHRRSVA